MSGTPRGVAVAEAFCPHLSCCARDFGHARGQAAAWPWHKHACRLTQPFCETFVSAGTEEPGPWVAQRAARAGGFGSGAVCFRVLVRVARRDCWFRTTTTCFRQGSARSPVVAGFWPNPRLGVPRLRSRKPCSRQGGRFLVRGWWFQNPGDPDECSRVYDFRTSFVQAFREVQNGKHAYTEFISGPERPAPDWRRSGSKGLASSVPGARRRGSRQAERPPPRPRAEQHFSRVVSRELLREDLRAEPARARAEVCPCTARGVSPRRPSRRKAWGRGASRRRTRQACSRTHTVWQPREPTVGGRGVCAGGGFLGLRAGLLRQLFGERDRDGERKKAGESAVAQGPLWLFPALAPDECVRCWHRLERRAVPSGWLERRAKHGRHHWQTVRGPIRLSWAASRRAAQICCGETAGCCQVTWRLGVLLSLAGPPVRCDIGRSGPRVRGRCARTGSDGARDPVPALRVGRRGAPSRWASPPGASAWTLAARGSTPRRRRCASPGISRRCSSARARYLWQQLAGSCDDAS